MRRQLADGVKQEQVREGSSGRECARVREREREMMGQL